MLHRKIQRNFVVINTSTNNRVFTGKKIPIEYKTPHYTKFDSEGEYKLYKDLYKYFQYPNYELQLQPKVSINNLNWKIDFRIKPLDNISSKNLSQLAVLLNCETYFDNSLLFEYKGTYDNNFKVKMDTTLDYYPRLTKAIVLVSYAVETYTCESKLYNAILTKPVYSYSYLRRLLEQVYYG